jgi:hypothetical protein
MMMTNVITLPSLIPMGLVRCVRAEKLPDDSVVFLHWNYSEVSVERAAPRRPITAKSSLNPLAKIESFPKTSHSD